MIDPARHSVAVFGRSALPGTITHPLSPLPQLIADLRGFSGIVVHPSVVAGRSDEASLILNLARAGVPVIGWISQEVREVLPQRLVSSVEEASVDDLADPELRDALSIRQRRAAWEGAFPTPPVSAVLVTSRPDFLDHALSQLGALSYPDLEIVIVTHGFSIGDALPASQIIEVPEAVPFGAALNRGFNAAKGELIVKFDDDDWYSSEHLNDLVCALHYSGASLVAKAAEFVYLDMLDITIRRMAYESETFDNRNVAGGTFCMKRDLFYEVGGWREISRHVDQSFLDDVERLGLHWYRTHGHGYVLNRRETGHTWDAPVDYFLDTSVAQYRGLARSATLLDTPSSGISEA